MRADDDIVGLPCMSCANSQWQASPQAIAYALHITVRGVLMALPSPVPRTNQKITKPQFFESYKSERTNISNLDTASAYITKKAVNSSIALSEKSFDTPSTEGVWGGIHSRYNLAVEMVPMMIKIQNASGSKLIVPLHVAQS
jgi:cell cycle checkpoint protein